MCHYPYYIYIYIYTHIFIIILRYHPYRSWATWSVRGLSTMHLRARTITLYHIMLYHSTSYFTYIISITIIITIIIYLSFSLSLYIYI